jgi:hypothetical protein
MRTSLASTAFQFSRKRLVCRTDDEKEGEFLRYDEDPQSLRRRANCARYAVPPIGSSASSRLGFICERTMSKPKVRRLMLSRDVFVLPSIFEPRAMVRLEVLVRGLLVVVILNWI